MKAASWVLALVCSSWASPSAAQAPAAPPPATASFPPATPPPAAPPPATTEPSPVTPGAPTPAQPAPPVATSPPASPAATSYPPGPYMPPGYTPPGYVAPAHAPAAGSPRADLGPTQAPPPPRRSRLVSLTISPLHLLSGPVLELMAELRLAEHFGVAVLGGFGEYTVEDDDLERDIEAAVYEIGGQLSWYPLDAFSNLAVGAEIDYVHIETEELPNSSITVLGDGLSFGPFVGYKLISSAGFTFLAQAGVQYVTLRAEQQEGDATLDEDERARFVPLLNLNLGWSF